MLDTRFDCSGISRRRAQLLTIGLAVVALGCGRTATELPAIALSIPASFLQFTARLGETAPPQTVTLVEAAARSVRWRAVPSVPWILLDPAVGTTPAAIRVSVTTTNAAPGTVRGGVRFEILTDEPHEEAVGLVVERTVVAPGWTSLDGPYGGAVYTVAVDPQDPQRVYAGVERYTSDANRVPGGLFLSGDGGDSFAWAPGAFSDETVYDLALAADGRGYAASQTGLHRTADHGVTWQPTSLTGTGVRALAMSGSDPALVFAVSDGKLWESSTGGTGIWSEISLLGSASLIAEDATQPGTFFAGDTSGHLYRISGSPNGPTISSFSFGASWTVNTAVALPQGRWLAGLSYPGAREIVWSDDQGNSWNVNSTWTAFSYPALLTWLDNRVWLAASAGLWVSEDQGMTFFEATASISTITSGYSGVVGHPNGLLAAHGTHGVFRNTGSFVFEPRRMFAHVVRQLEWLEATGEISILTSLNTAYHWSAAEGFTLLAGEGFPIYDTFVLSSDPRNPSSVCALSRSSGLHCTSDHGRTWLSTGVGLSAPYYYGLDRAPGSPDTMWVGTDNGMFRTTDGTIFAQLPGTTGSAISNLAAVSESVALYSQPDLRRYDWASSSFSVVGGPTVCLLVRSLDGALWYDDCSGGLYRSTDQALSFTAMGPGIPRTTAVATDPSRPGRIVLGYEQGLVVSADDGATWSSVAAPFPVTSLALDPASGDVYVGTISGGVYRYAE
jgi:hypothetical protein